MAFFNRAGYNILRQTNTVMHVASPSILQVIRCMSNLKVFVGGVGQATDETSLREAFSAFGKVSKARVIMDRKTGRSRGFGFVTFADADSASAAIAKMDQMELHGRKVGVRYANNRPQGGDGSLSIDLTKLFVGGMSQVTNDTSLREAFSAYGEVTEARVIMDRKTGRSRGFGFVTFEDPDCAFVAMDAMDQWELHGRTVTVWNASYKSQGGYSYGTVYFGDGGYGGGGGSGYCGFDNVYDGPVDDIACTCCSF